MANELMSTSEVALFLGIRPRDVNGLGVEGKIQRIEDPDRGLMYTRESVEAFKAQRDA